MKNPIIVKLTTTGEFRHFIPSTAHECDALLPFVDQLDQFPDLIRQKAMEAEQQGYEDNHTFKNGAISLSICDGGQRQLGLDSSLFGGSPAEWSKLEPYIDDLPQKISQVKAALTQRAAAGGAQ
ncbi:MAG: hypothetical protein HOL04_04025 [Gammaproteobacteria bacterium]|nr:hypothetical protein [Gammaproteobacteria bacterium]MBT6669703.1 hypothetical protein [Gammaproteobacteria bacterium]MBT7023837.1 hypothetical protein [Gammaproteobacteria bacterium]